METAKKQSGSFNADGSRTPAAGHELYRDHRDWLRDLARRRFRLQPADAEDIVQDAYLRLAQQGVTPIRRPRAFLAQIALNLFRDSKRRNSVRAAHANGERISEEAWPDPKGLAEQETQVELERLILSLPEPQRDVFVLSRFRHMSNRDIAEHLEISIKTVEWRMSRALDFCISRLRD